MSIWLRQVDNKLEVAPTNKKVDGVMIFNYNLYEEQLIKDGYIKYDGDKDIEQLKIVNDEIVEKTAEEIEQENNQKILEEYRKYYNINPDLQVCVTAYKNILDKLKLPYTAKMSDISSEILKQVDMTDQEKTVMGFTIQGEFNNIVLNLEYIGINRANYFAWQNMNKLIESLPE